MYHQSKSSTAGRRQGAIKCTVTDLFPPKLYQKIAKKYSDFLSKKVLCTVTLIECFLHIKRSRIYYVDTPSSFAYMRERPINVRYIFNREILLSFKDHLWYQRCFDLDEQVVNGLDPKVVTAYVTGQVQPGK